MLLELMVLVSSCGYLTLFEDALPLRVRLEEDTEI